VKKMIALAVLVLGCFCIAQDTTAGLPEWFGHRVR